MAARIAIVGMGAVGAYVGAYMVRAGEDVTCIDPWPEHVEQVRKHGLRVIHAKDVPEFDVKLRALHICDVQQLGKEAPIDIAFICMKSYDTAWSTALIAPYLSPGGYVVSLQNCIMEETIAGIVGWGRTVGCIVSSILVAVYEPGVVQRGGGKSKPSHNVFRAGEVHGRLTARVREVCRLVGLADNAKVTENLWGERWSKLVGNSVLVGLGACTGLSANELSQNQTLLRFSIRLGSEAVRVGQALGYELEDMLHVAPETLARAGEGDAAALKIVEDQRLADTQSIARGHHLSMGQDMLKGRRTEIDDINGLVARQGEKIGVSVCANAALTDLVKRVESGALKPDPEHVLRLRLN